MSPVRRTTIATADPEASLRFYRDLLGFVVAYDREGAGGGRLHGALPNADGPYRYEVNRGPTDTFTVFDPNCVRISIARIQRETLEQSLQR